MRLITFQNKCCLTVLKENKWYSTKNNRLKLVDYDYADEGKKIYPIYTFASFGPKNNTYFGLESFYQSLTYLAGFMKFNLNEIVMVELEVPESFILNMKKHTESFEVRCNEKDPDRELMKYDQYKKEHVWLKRDLSRGTIYTSDYLSIVRGNRESEYEALIPYLDRTHIVAIRSFRQCGGYYGNTKVETIYTNDSLCPLWCGVIYLNGDGYAKFNEEFDADLIKQIKDAESRGKVINKEKLAMNKYGANKVPGYFTVREALACANIELRESIINMIRKHELSNDTLDKVIFTGRKDAIFSINGFE